MAYDMSSIVNIFYNTTTLFGLATETWSAFLDQHLLRAKAGNLM